MGRPRHRGLAGRPSMCASPRPAGAKWKPGQLRGSSPPTPTRKQTPLGQESRPKPLEFTGQKRDLGDQVLILHTHVPTHTSQVGKWRPREDRDCPEAHSAASLGRQDSRKMVAK